MSIDRRLTVSTFLSIILIAAIFALGCKKEAGKEEPVLRVVSYGGAYQEAQRQAIFSPFEREHGVRIEEGTHAGDLAKIQAMVETGRVEWDVVDVETHMLTRGAREDLFEKIETRLLPDGVFDSARHEYGVAACFWSTVLGYRDGIPSQLEQRLKVEPWKVFWGREGSDLRRSLRNSPVTTLEAALLADGVPPADLYPLDVDRAFEKIAELRGRVHVWWEAGEQPVQLLSSGEVQLSSVWNGRIQNAISAGKPLSLVWANGILDADWWVIPSGAENSKLAQDFIAFASQPEQQAALASLIPYGPVNEAAFELIDSEVVAQLPTSPANRVQQIQINAGWWDENTEKVHRRWERWMNQTDD